MQKYLRELKADQFGDLIAMNALYRPGPLEYIPTFIKRKHGLEKIVYDLPEMEELLKETYGVTVYQEQVMLLSQKLAGFTKGDADVLRKAMGKKDRATLDKMKGKFLEGTAERGFDSQGLRQDLDRLGGLRAVCLQQIAQHVLRLRGLPDRVVEGQLPQRVHGQRAHPLAGQHRQDHLLHGGMPAYGHLRAGS
jgi:hypothetical protein